MAGLVNDAQHGILKKIIDMPDEVTSYQVALALKKEPAAVARSIQLLEENGFLRIEKAKKGVARPLKLTDKGLLYLYGYGGIDIEKYFAENKKEDSYYMFWLKKVLPDSKETRQKFYQVIYEELFAVVNFDKEGTLVKTPIRNEVPNVVLDLLQTIITLSMEKQIAVDKKALGKFIEDVQARFIGYFDELRKELR